MKIGKRQLMFALGALAALLVGYSLLRFLFGVRLPERLDAELPNFVMMGALLIFLWNRKLAADEKKAAAAADAAAAEVAAASTPVAEAAAVETDSAGSALVADVHGAGDDRRS